MFGLEQIAGQLIFRSTQLLKQSSYNLMKLLQLRVPIVIIGKAECGILLQSNLRCDVFDDV
jgi:hypothetical protein